MAQQTRTGSDVPANLPSPVPSGTGPKTRAGSAVNVLGYDAGYAAGYAAAKGDGVPPVISAFSPAPGLIDVDDVEARYTPITFNVRDSDGLGGIVVAVWFDGEPYPSLAYTLDAGFSGLFAASRAGVAASSATSSGGSPPTEVDFSLLPVGGWRREVKQVSVTAWDRGGTLATVVGS